MSIESVMPSSHLILCHPLLLLPSIFPSIRAFSNESVLCIRWPKYWSFRFSISPSNGYSGLISFRIGWLDLLAIQETLKSLLQYHSSKTSILYHSAFFVTFALLHSVLQGQICLLLQVSLDFLLLHSSALWWKGHCFGVLFLEGLIGLHRTVQLQLLQHYCLRHRLGLLYIEWFALETNWGYSVTFEIAPKYCILDSCWLWELLHFF